MLFIVRFHDREEALPLRHEHMQAHLDWLAAHAAQVRMAGSLREAIAARFTSKASSTTRAE